MKKYKPIEFPIYQLAFNHMNTKVNIFLLEVLGNTEFFIFGDDYELDLLQEELRS